ncbi:pyruvate ferredoxin oxidoreductase [Candidatus Woesearchaeota archaeon]|nr:pyruvate ferredoxin oxidoreductase [Candidatus Woesearchaeota archaeon]
MVNIKEFSSREERLSSGHRLCGGCGAPIIARMVTKATKDPVVIVNATGCLEVATTIYPYTAWKVPWMHNAFENAAATISGIETAFRALKKKGKIKKEIKFIAFGGDGGTYDIGLQSMSGAFERGHKFVYVCYDNEAYMNTGIQRSGATPYGASTTTAPAGKVKQGKEQFRKDLTSIAAAHHVPYVAQAAPSEWNDLITKAEKALNADGPAFLNVLSPCPRGWRFPENLTIEISKLAIKTRFWPLIEIENGKWTLNKDITKPLPIKEWIKSQGRYSHLLKPGNEAIIEKIQERVNKDWEKIKKLCS